MPKPLENWGDFPKIGLIVEGKKGFFSLREAIPLWDSMFLNVKDSEGKELLLSDFNVREMTDEENKEFQRRVDEFSGSK